MGTNIRRPTRAACGCGGLVVAAGEPSCQVLETVSRSAQRRVPGARRRRCRAAVCFELRLTQRGWGVEPTAKRLLAPPRPPRSGSGTTNAPKTHRNRDCSHARPRTCRRAQGSPRSRNRCVAHSDSEGPAETRQDRSPVSKSAGDLDLLLVLRSSHARRSPQTVASLPRGSLDRTAPFDAEQPRRRRGPCRRDVGARGPLPLTTALIVRRSGAL
jgi:hypothetical protein